jgi:hypothetical protein
MWKRIQRLVFGVVPSMLGMLGVVAGVAGAACAPTDRPKHRPSTVLKCPLGTGAFLNGQMRPSRPPPGLALESHLPGGCRLVLAMVVYFCL